jgi:hypothetical protein
MAEVYTDKGGAVHRNMNWIWIALLAVIALVVIIALVR